MAKTTNIYGAMSGLAGKNIHSKVRITHENLMSDGMSEEFNTYRMWSAVNLVTEVDPLTTDDYEKDKDGNWVKKNQRTVAESTGIRAIFNKWHAVPAENKSFAWRVSQNMPLIDSPKTRQLQRSMNSCTVRDLVEKSAAGLLGASVYSYSDFMFCKYLGRVPNNYLITLRRYTVPVLDYIKPYGNPSAVMGGKESTQTDGGGAPIGTMVTWMGTPGNEMKEIMKYDISMPYKQVNSSFESDGERSKPGVDKSSGGAIGGAFQKAFNNNIVGQHLANHIMPGMFNRRAGQSNPERAPYYDKNKAYAGVDMVKSIYVRDAEKGLQFKQSFKLVFDYELRSYDGVNGKQAMLDLLGNILSVCYTNGDFWGGAYRHEAGSSSMQPMSSLECMQHHGTFSGYVNAFNRDFQKIRGRVANMTKNPLETLKTLLNDLGGALLGGDMNLAPIQYKTGVNSLLSDTAVGLWHVTVGNPCAPMMSIGNLILTNTTIEHYGPLGIDDFPTGLRVTCTFDTGKPRDKRLIERIYNGGNDRIYSPLDQSILNSLNNAPDVHSYDKADTDVNGNASHIVTTTGYNTLDDVRNGTTGGRSIQSQVVMSAELSKRDEEAKSMAEKLIPNKEMSVSGYHNKNLSAISTLRTADLVKKYFGTAGQYAINVTSGEMNEGFAAPTTDPNTGKV